jgi:hopanoid biosynthesis associated RND transporter like protein HpnN
MLDRLFAAIVAWSTRHARLFVPAMLLLTALAGFYTARNIGFDTDTTNMISPELPWRQELSRFNDLFPQNSGLLVVMVDGATPDIAEDAAAALFERVAARPDLFASARRADGGPFFQRYGLLFLKTEDVRKIADAVIEAQPFIGAISQDPSLRGLFDVLSLAMRGVRGRATGMERLERPLTQIAATLSDALAGGRQAMSWQALMLNRAAEPRELRKLILTQPNRNFTSLKPSAAASAFIRETAKELNLTPATGVTVRLTGQAALNDDEFATVREGMGFALVLSALLVLGLLFIALRSFKLIFATFATLIVGLILTFTFATLAVGSLNLISIAFAVMFIGLSIDFGIQYGVRFGQEAIDAAPEPLVSAGAAMARPLTLAAIATAVGFAAFIPTDYSGVSELGRIASAGMAITLVLNVTLLPALLALLRPRIGGAEMTMRWTRRLDSFLERRRRLVLVFWLALAATGLALSPRLAFDFHPLHLKDPKVESMAAILDLMKDPLRTPYAIEVLAPDAGRAEELKQALAALPEVYAVLSASTFVPKEQDEKLAILADLELLLGLSLTPLEQRSAPSVAEIRTAFRQCAASLRTALPDSSRAQELARLLDQAADADPAIYPELHRMLVGGLMPRMAALATALTAGPLSVDTLPDDIRRDWIAADGSWRLTVMPKGDSNDNTVLADFVTAVRSVAPHATGPAVQIYESGRAVTRAFQIATLTAVVAIALLLAMVLRRLRDVIYVLLPLLVATLATIVICVGIGLKLDFANVIALPLLLGIGVAFNIYFVVNWRRGIEHALSTGTARAVLFSALTTAASFGSLALSSHPGTSRMGLLLLIALGVLLAVVFGFLPAMLGRPPRDQTR